MKITENMSILEAIRISKYAVKVLEKYGLDCAGCRGAGEDTVARVAENNGLDVREFVAELNKTQE